MGVADSAGCVLLFLAGVSDVGAGESPGCVVCNFLVGGFSSIHLGCVADQRDEGGYRHAAAVAAQNIVGDKSSQPPST